MKQIAPNATGNLATNSIRSWPTPTGFRIVSLGNVAPYNVFTDGKWVSPRWKGKKNPNEGWFTVIGATAIYRYVDSYYNDNLNSDTTDFNELAKKSKNNKQRTKLFNNSIPKR
jgi:hypothetical protein